MKANEVLDNLKRRFPNEPEYHQAVAEVLGTIEEAYNEHPEFEKSNLIERLCIPDRIFSFRVTWVDDKGQVQTNMGYRIQHNNVIGPYKGGIRFHASVNQSILKFLAFEQTFKNSLTTLPMGGGKGGADFSPRGKSNAEIMRFCQAFVMELWRHIGPDTDVPAGDIGVGGREVAYMYGMYKKLARENTGTFTGKGIEFGGSLIRPEATGYGNVYFLLEMLNTRNIDIKGKVVARMRPSEGHFQPNVVMSDRELAQLTFAYRIFDHDVDISVSTREAAHFRNHIATLGATSLSAGSKTDPGGYYTYPQALEQFAVSDERTPAEVAEAIRAMGYEVVWKDWDKIFD